LLVCYAAKILFFVFAVSKLINPSTIGILKMKAMQRGFTLIELVMVIVILGVLSAVALPKFVDLKSDAQQAAIDGAAGALNSAMAINYAAYNVSSAKGTRLNAATPIQTLITAGGVVGWGTQVEVKEDGTCDGIGAGKTASGSIQLKTDTTKTATVTSICTG
jgi:MSHA pilin protein MshA